jgi:hypothetical protein
LLESAGGGGFISIIAGSKGQEHQHVCVEEIDAVVASLARLLGGDIPGHRQKIDVQGSTNFLIYPFSAVEGEVGGGTYAAVGRGFFSFVSTFFRLALES